MNILIADDHAIVRKGLSKILLEQKDFAEVGEASNGEELLALVREKKWSLVILDITMPGKNTLELLKELKASYPLLPILILSIHPEDQFALRILRAGASGYLNKASAPEELINAIRQVLRGELYTSPQMTKLLVTELDPLQKRSSYTSLSDREYEVLSLFASGKRLKEIAESLSISVKSVGTYRTRILIKLGLKNNVQLIRYALENNLSQ